MRNGSVVDLQIAPREVTAMVSGSSLYRVTVGIDAVPEAQWQSICKDCAGGIDSLVELLQGRLSQGVMERICRQGLGLFPAPRQTGRLLQEEAEHLARGVGAARVGEGAGRTAARTPRSCQR